MCLIIKMEWKIKVVFWRAFWYLYEGLTHGALLEIERQVIEYFSMLEEVEYSFACRIEYISIDYVLIMS